MARLIDADRALEIVFDQGVAHPIAYHLTNYATLILREAPTVDAVEVVRCQDCKHHDDTSIPEYKHCFVNARTVQSDDFCSFGERKDGDGHGG